MAKAKTGTNGRKSITTAQIIGSAGGEDSLPPTGGMSPKTKRLTLEQILIIRQNPTVRMMTRAIIGALTKVGWNYQVSEDVNPELATWLSNEFEDHRSHLLRNGLMGAIEWGWAPFEKLIDLDPVTNRYTLHKAKSLLQNSTEILVNSESGDFEGFKQADVEIPLDSCLLCSFDVDGTDWRGNSLTGQRKSGLTFGRALPMPQTVTIKRWRERCGL